jgi:uncharacterized membrane protein YoaK (UPF0700 family)
MTIQFLRRLTGKRRTNKADEHLGFALAFVAGAANAGGFLAVKQYTSHMTGIVSSMADELVLGNLGLAIAGLGALISFVAGAACSAILINWARRKRLHSVYALSLMLEAFLLLCFGLAGANLSHHMGLHVSLTVMLLCFIMGLQNAIITKISNSRIRTTHVTGLVTDLGIELGKLFYWNIEKEHPPENMVLGNRIKLRLLASLLLMFFIGGLAGAFGFNHIGFISTIPLAFILLILAIVPVLDDVVFRFK